MPVYEYRCRGCGKEFEQRVSMSTPTAEIACPGCKEQQAERIMSVFYGKGSSPSAGADVQPCMSGGMCSAADRAMCGRGGFDD